MGVTTMAISKRDVIQALNRAQLPGSARTALQLQLVIDVLVNGDALTVLVADRTVEGPVPAGWLRSLESAAQSVPGVASVRIEQRPQGTAAPSVQTAQRGGRQEVPMGSTRVLAVASGKGGVGKSTVTANLAFHLAALGQRVGALDADIYGFSLPSLLGADRPPEVSPDRRLIPTLASGVRLLSMDFFVPAGEAVIWRGPMLGKALQEFLGHAQWPELDWMLLDLPPGTGDVALDIHEMLPGSLELVVTTPDPLAARVAVRAGQMARKAEHTVVGVVENMSALRCTHCGEPLTPFGQGGGAEVAAALGVPLLAQVPLGDPVRPGTGLFAEGSPTAEVFHRLAQDVLARVGDQGAGSGR